MKKKSGMHELWQTLSGYPKQITTEAAMSPSAATMQLTLQETTMRKQGV